MEIYTKIIELKNALGKTSNNPYTRVNTSEGWINCHEPSVVDELKTYVGGMCTIAVRETPRADGNGVWRNIIGINKDTDEAKSKLPTENTQPIKEHPNNQRAPSVPMEDTHKFIQPIDDKTVTVLTSYAKDIWLNPDNEYTVTECVGAILKMFKDIKLGLEEID